MAYATYEDVQIRLGKTFSETEQATCGSLLDRAALMIDSYSAAADKSDDAKQEVSVNMVSRVMADSASEIPIGASQGSMSGLGYAQSWTISGGGSVGNLYLDKTDKRLLGIGNQVGSYSPVQELVPEVVV